MLDVTFDAMFDTSDAEAQLAVMAVVIPTILCYFVLLALIVVILTHTNVFVGIHFHISQLSHRKLIVVACIIYGIISTTCEFGRQK